MSHPAFDSLWDGQAKADPLDELWGDSRAAKPKAKPASKPTDANNQPTAEELAAAEPDIGMPGAFGHALLATGANIAQGLPGMEAVEAKASSLANRIPYRDALTTIRGETGKIQKPLRVGEQMVGALPLLKMPLSPAKAGGVIGAASALADADPDKGLVSRASDAAVGGAAGMALGKGTELLTTAARTLLPPKLGGTPTPAANLFKRLADQAQSAKVLYGAANAEGKMHEVTPAITSFLEQEDIAPIVQRLQQTTHQGVDAHSPEMLDALYKTLSDQAKNVEKGLAGPDPAKVNTGRYNLQWIKDRQKQLLSAMSAPGEARQAVETAQSPAPSLRDALSNFDRVKGVAAQRVEGTPAQQMARRALERHGAENIVSPPLTGAPPMVEGPAYMPSYRDAVQDFAKQSSAMDALKNARIIAQKKITNAQIPANALTKKTPEALQDMVSNPRIAENLPAMREGILGAAKEELPKGVVAAKRALSKTPSLLRITNDKPQAMLDLLTKLGLIGTNTELHQ